MTTSRWPQPLDRAVGPMAGDRIDGAAAGLGRFGPTTAALVADGWIPPDLACSMGLFILARQPRPEPPAESADRPAKTSAITGSVWVREQCTIHTSFARTEAFTVEGENLNRFARKRRRYASSGARSFGADGRPLTTNLTTGLTSYRPVDGLADHHDGVPFDELAQPAVDFGSAGANPHLARIAETAPGTRFESPPITVTLAMMAARDTAHSDNPIHSDPEQARAAGLDRPIAGGNHVLSFALELLLAAWGPSALSHGALIDTRWKAPVSADDTIVSRAEFRAADRGTVTADLTVTLLDEHGNPGATAMQSTVTVPVAGTAAS
ncbi:MAG: MaoC family dehydratase [Acidimicrobiales bacterium]